MTKQKRKTIKHSMGRGFRGGGRRVHSDQYRQRERDRPDFQQRRHDDYGEEDFGRNSPGHMRRGQRFRSQSGRSSFLDDNGFRGNARREDLNYRFDDMPPMGSSGFYGGPNRLMGGSGLLSSSEGPMGSNAMNPDDMGRGFNTRQLEEQLRMRETQLALTSNLLKEQTQLLARVGGALNRRPVPGRRDSSLLYAIKRRSVRSGDFPLKRLRYTSSSLVHHGTSIRHSDYRGRGQRGNVRGRGLRRGLGSQHSETRQKDSMKNHENDKKKGSSLKKVKAEYTKPEDIPDHDPAKPIGDRYIVNVQGFYCKLCNKFYQNEHSAKVQHASLKTHYDKWKAAVLLSIKNRNKDADEKPVSESVQPTKEDKEENKEEEAKTVTEVVTSTEANEETEKQETKT